MHDQENNQDVKPQSPLDEQDTTGRREMIQRCAKYALVGIPLLLFVSKSHASIQRSRP
jgi:hypothetical protein